MYLNLREFFVGALETLSLEESIKDGVLKMTKDSMMILKGVRWNNLYYLKGSTITGQVATSTDTDDDSTRLWHMRLGFFANSCKARIIERCQNMQTGFL